MKVIKASELGVYLYCHRAWSYQRRGVTSQNQAALDLGTAYHKKHGGMVMLTGVLRALAALLMILAVIVLIALILRWVTG